MISWNAWKIFVGSSIFFSILKNVWNNKCRHAMMSSDAFTPDMQFMIDALNEESTPVGHMHTEYVVLFLINWHADKSINKPPIMNIDSTPAIQAFLILLAYYIGFLCNFEINSRPMILDERRDRANKTTNDWHNGCWWEKLTRETTNFGSLAARTAENIVERIFIPLWWGWYIEENFSSSAAFK